MRRCPCGRKAENPAQLLGLPKGPKGGKAWRHTDSPSCMYHSCQSCGNYSDLSRTRFCSKCKIARNECFLCSTNVSPGKFFCANHTCTFCAKGAENGHCADHKSRQSSPCKFIECGICRQYPPSSTCSTCAKCKTCLRTLEIKSGCSECPGPTSANDRRCEKCSCRVCPDVALPKRTLCKTHWCWHCGGVLHNGICVCMCIVQGCFNQRKFGSDECDSHKCSLCKVTSLFHGRCPKCQCRHCDKIKLPGLDVCSDHWCDTCKSVKHRTCNCYCIYCANPRIGHRRVCSEHVCKTCFSEYFRECEKCKCAICTKIGQCSAHTVQPPVPRERPRCAKCRRYEHVEYSDYCTYCKCEQCSNVGMYTKQLKNRKTRLVCADHYCTSCGEVKENRVCPSCSIGHKCTATYCYNIVDERSKNRLFCVAHNCHNCRTITPIRDYNTGELVRPRCSKHKLASY